MKERTRNRKRQIRRKTNEIEREIERERGCVWTYVQTAACWLLCLNAAGNSMD